jgi:hypothetical protein
MSVVFFVCPQSEREVSSNIDMHPDDFRGLPPVLSDIRCTDCGQIHNLFDVPVRLSDELAEATEAG